MKNPELWDEMLSQVKLYKTEYVFFLTHHRIM